MKMIRNCSLLNLILFAWSIVSAQNQKVSCNCPATNFADRKADTLFHLSNGETIALCGYKNPNSKPVTFSEFVLAVCGQDTIIDFWGAVLTCRLAVHDDTLLVERLENLPVGMDFKYQETVARIEKIYFHGKNVVRKLGVNKQITKYNQAEIQTILRAYETAKPGLDESKMKIANELFIASISGDKTARKYFKEFETKFGKLDGAFEEEYDDLAELLALWDKEN